MWEGQTSARQPFAHRRRPSSTVAFERTVATTVRMDPLWGIPVRVGQPPLCGRCVQPVTSFAIRGIPGHTMGGTPSILCEIRPLPARMKRLLFERLNGACTFAEDSPRKSLPLRYIHSWTGFPIIRPMNRTPCSICCRGSRSPFAVDRPSVPSSHPPVPSPVAPGCVLKG